MTGTAGQTVRGQDAPDLGAQVVAAARGWIGTPYRHQAARKGAGTDCLGLIRGVWREVMGAEPEAVPAYSMDWSEPQGEERLWQAALRHLVPVAKGAGPPCRSTVASASMR